MDAREGGGALHLHRRPRPVRRARHRVGARPGRRLRRRGRPPGRLQGGPRRGGAGRADLRRVPHQVRRPRLLQHHAAGPGGHRHAAGPGHARRRGADLGRRLHLQGQRHRAVLPVRAARQPGACGSTSPGWTPTFVGRARRPGGDVAVAARPGAALPGEQGEGVLDRREHLGRHPRGQVARAPRRQRRDRRADHGRAVLGPGVEIAAEDVTITFERGRPVAINGKEFASAGRAGARGQRDRRPARPRHVRPDREPDHRGQVARHLRGAGHGAAARRLRAAGLRDPQRGHRSPPTTTRAASSAGCCTRAAGSTRRR